MLQSQQARVTHCTDGWIAVRDEAGHLWCEYHPERRVIRRYQKFDRERLYCEIPIDSLISGSPVVTITRRPS